MAIQKSNKRRNQSRNLKPVPVNCPFCKEKKVPDYKNYTELAGYLTDRAKIVPKSRSGICTKHQRKIAVEVKRARHLGLLPFVASF